MRLLVHVEGQTEEQFVNEILSPHLRTRGYTLVFPQLLGKRGGICSWTLARRDISRGLEEDRGRISTTFVDYYGLPAA